jgi:hypothetical protein
MHTAPFRVTTPSLLPWAFWQQLILSFSLVFSTAFFFCYNCLAFSIDIIRMTLCLLSSLDMQSVLPRSHLRYYFLCFHWLLQSSCTEGGHSSIGSHSSFHAWTDLYQARFSTCNFLSLPPASAGFVSGLLSDP